MSDRPRRRLAAIVVTDVVGYSRLIGLDEEGTLDALRAVRRDLLNPLLAEHGGRVANTAGDSLLIEFASAVDAVRFGIAMQTQLAERNAGLPDAQGLHFRVGVNIGDVVGQGDDLLGDGVNIAARLEGQAEPGGIAMSDDAYRQIRGRVDADWTDAGETDLKNIARPVRIWRWSGAQPPDGRAEPALPEKAAGVPSIAVLPFDNMSADPDQEHFCDGLVEDIITTLSKLAGLRVVARNSSFAYKGRPVDAREAARQLGVRYLLEGSVRTAGSRIRITAQLIDAADGAHLWAERYDRAIDDIFAIQDEITLVVATELQVTLTEGEQARLNYTTTGNVEAWTHWVKGLSHFRKSVTRDQMGQARHHWEKALAVDPDSAALHARLGFLHACDARFGWWDERATALDKAETLIGKALSLDPGNADAHSAASLLHMLREDFGAAVREARRAVALAPGSADVAELASFVLAPSGHPEEAVELSRKAISLSPRHPAVYLGQLGNACHLAGRIDEAIAAFEEYDARNPGLGFGLADLVIIHQQNGRPEKARETAERLRSARPDFTVAAWRKTQYRADRARLEADADALRRAGLPPGEDSG